MIDNSDLEEFGRLVLQSLVQHGGKLKFVVVIARKEAVGTTFAVASELTNQSTIRLLEVALAGLSTETTEKPTAGEG